MGVKSPSIYAAFGDKRSLFAEALSLYAENEGAASKNAFVGRASARDAIHSMLHNSIELLMRFDPPRSCLVALGAFHSGDPVINAMLLERRMEIKIALRSLLESSEREGEILPGSPATLATIYSTFLHGLSIQIYDGETAEQLYAAANALLESWPVHQTI